jgi:hypothetical protein
MSSPDRILPPEREVDCPCDTAYHRAVFLDSSGRNQRVIACLHCGEVSFIECQTEEPHPNHVICIANRVLALGGAAKSWLSQWPRRVYLTYNDPPAYLRASYRVRNLEQLSADIERAVNEQREWSGYEKAIHAGIPKAPPPELPDQLYAYRESWNAFQWDESTSTKDLVLAIHGGPGSSEVAGDLLRRRPDAVAVVTEMIASFVPSERKGALYAIYREKIRSPAIAEGLVHLLKTLPRNETHIEPVLTALLGLGAIAAPARPVLRDLAGRSMLDYYFHKRLKQVEEIIAKAEHGERAT